MGFRIGGGRTAAWAVSGVREAFGDTAAAAAGRGKGTGHVVWACDGGFRFVPKSR